MGRLEADIYRVEPNPDGEWWVMNKGTEGYAADRILVDQMKHEPGVTYEFGGPDLFHCVTHTGPVLTNFHKFKLLRDARGAVLLPANDRVRRTKRSWDRPPSMIEMEKAIMGTLHDSV